MSQSIPAYRLIRDLPDLKAGEIFSLITEAEYSDVFYQSEHSGDGGIPIVYTEKTILANPNFFIDASVEPENKYAPMVDGLETEIVNVKGSQYPFDVTIPKNFTYSKCNYCGIDNLIWGLTKKKGKKILVRFDSTQNNWVAHISECTGNKTPGGQ